MNHFFSSTTCLDKIKKITTKNRIIVCALPETEDHINSFQVDFPSSDHPRTSENLWFLIFLGGCKETLLI